VSCGLHDVARLEERGVPTVFLVTEAFVDAVAEQLPLLGFAGYAPVWVTHPVASLPRAAAEARADEVLDTARAVLLGTPRVRQAAAERHDLLVDDPGCGDVACAVDLVESRRR
jgi:hypothetical protein